MCIERHRPALLVFLYTITVLKRKAKRPIIVLRHFMLIQKRACNAC
jgi:hypothetical protein